MRFALACLLPLLLTSPLRSAWGYDDLVLPSVDFSATAVQQTGAVQTTQTIHYMAGKLRIDPGNGFSSTILDLTTQTQYLLMANHTYLVLPMDDELFRRFFARTTTTSGAQKQATDRAADPPTTKYAFGEDGALQAAGNYWLSNQGIMTRREYDDGVFGQNAHHREFLRDITFEKQPADLFVIPAGYRLAK
jgi:hypothetical protein